MRYARREPVPYIVAVADLLRRIEALPCPPVITIVERPDTAAAVGRPIPEQPAEAPAPVRPIPEQPAEAPAPVRLRRGETIIRSVVDGRWVIVTPAS